MGYEIRPSHSGASGIVEIVLLLCLISLFLLVVAVVFVVKTFVRYSNHVSLWLSLAICLVLSIIGGVLAAKVNQGFLALPYIGVAVLLITCYVVHLKNADTLMRENVNLIDEVLRKPWEWASDTKTVELEREQLAA